MRAISEPLKPHFQLWPLLAPLAIRGNSRIASSRTPFLALNRSVNAATTINLSYLLMSSVMI
eukprot:3339341-Pyramimonas_sp.AAC.1